MTDTQRVIKTETWKVTYKPFVTKKEVDAATKKASYWQKLRLLFRRSYFSIDYSDDGVYIARYKKMDDTVFVMKRGTKFYENKELL